MTSFATLHITAAESEGGAVAAAGGAAGAGRYCVTIVGGAGAGGGGCGLRKTAQAPTALKIASATISPIAV